MSRKRLFRSGLAVAAAALVASSTGAFAAEGEPVRITKAFNVTGDDLSPTRTYSAPHMAVDPEDPMRIVASTPEFRTKQCKLMVTTNGGRNWKILDSTPSPPSYPFCFHTSGTAYQTQVAFGRNGTIYYALSGYDNNDLTPADAHGGVYGHISVLLARSDDFGQNWQTTVVRSTRGEADLNKAENNRPVTGLAVDTKTGDQDIVYIGWRRGAAPGVTPAPPSQPMLSVSRDGGRTFGEPISAADAWAKTKPEPDKYGGSNINLAVDDKGTLYAAFLGATTVPNTQANAVVVAKSTDQGKTFTAAEARGPSRFYLPLIMEWSDTGGEDGTIHILVEDKVGPTAGESDRDIYYVRSTDGGKTFTEGKRINDDDPQDREPGGGHLQVNPNISIAPNGRLDVSWWDFREDTGGFTNDVYYSYSEDNGTTWSKNLRITDRSIDRRIGVWSNGYDMRTPVGMVSTDKLAVLAWDDTRNSIRVGDGQDIFASVVQFEAIGGGGSDAARYALAALGGLAAVGLILLAVSFAANRRTPTEGGPAVRPAAAPADRVNAKK
jgi:hypothetical protein